MKKALLFSKAMFMILLVSLIFSCAKDTNQKTDLTKAETLDLRANEFEYQDPYGEGEIWNVNEELEGNTSPSDKDYCVFKITEITSDVCDKKYKVGGIVCTKCPSTKKCKKNVHLRFWDSTGTVVQCQFKAEATDTKCLDCPEGGITSTPH